MDALWRVLTPVDVRSVMEFWAHDFRFAQEMRRFCRMDEATKLLTRLRRFREFGFMQGAFAESKIQGTLIASRCEMATWLDCGEVSLVASEPAFWVIGYAKLPGAALSMHTQVGQVLVKLKAEGVRYVGADVHPDNAPSIALLERVGFTCLRKEDRKCFYVKDCG